MRLGGRVGGARPGRKLLTLVAAILAGATHIDHVDRLRLPERRHKVLPFRVMAPSTLGTFLRAFTFGHIRQLDKVMAETIRRAWSLGVGPGDGRMVIDLDSTICEVHGKLKQGALYGYTHVLGYHPLVAVWSKTGEILHARLRQGSSQRGHKRFVEELVARVRRAGAAGPLVVRADAGFWSWALIDTLGRAGPGVVHHGHDQPPDQNLYRGHRRVRLGPHCLSRRRRGPSSRGQLPHPCARRGAPPCAWSCAAPGSPARAQRALWPDWRHHAFVTDLEFCLSSGWTDFSTASTPTVELAIRDLKEGAGLEHRPSGRFFANAAWLACAVLAHNLIRWSSRLGDVHPDDQLTVARTVRTRVLALPGRLVNRSGAIVLRLPERWPWATTFTRGSDQIRGLPMVT